MQSQVNHVSPVQYWWSDDSPSLQIFSRFVPLSNCRAIASSTPELAVALGRNFLKALSKLRLVKDNN